MTRNLARFRFISLSLAVCSGGSTELIDPGRISKNFSTCLRRDLQRDLSLISYLRCYSGGSQRPGMENQNLSEFIDWSYLSTRFWAPPSHRADAPPSHRADSPREINEMEDWAGYGGRVTRKLPRFRIISLSARRLGGTCRPGADS